MSFIAATILGLALGFTIRFLWHSSQKKLRMPIIEELPYYLEAVRDEHTIAVIEFDMTKVQWVEQPVDFPPMVIEIPAYYPLFQKLEQQLQYNKEDKRFKL
jgi:hypothetical protein